MSHYIVSHLGLSIHGHLEYNNTTFTLHNIHTCMSIITMVLRITHQKSALHEAIRHREEVSSYKGFEYVCEVSQVVYCMPVSEAMNIG